MLTFIEAAVLGIIQGIFEWLPVSSEGMTSLVMINLFGKSFSDAVAMSIWLHAGTMFAAVFFFRKDLAVIIRNIPSYLSKHDSHNHSNHLITFLIMSTVVSGIVGLPLILYALGSSGLTGRAATLLIGLLLIFTGVVQKKVSGMKDSDRQVNVRDGFIAGFVQGFAALPGISRSGITVSALLLRKFDAKEAMRLSFIMSIPAVIAAEIGLGLMNLIVFDVYSLVAVFFSFVFGLLTIKALFKIAGKVDFSVFCIAVGLLSVAAFFI